MIESAQAMYFMDTLLSRFGTGSEKTIDVSEYAVVFDISIGF